MPPMHGVRLNDKGGGNHRPSGIRIFDVANYNVLKQRKLKREYSVK